MHIFLGGHTSSISRLRLQMYVCPCLRVCHSHVVTNRSPLPPRTLRPCADLRQRRPDVRPAPPVHQPRLGRAAPPAVRAHRRQAGRRRRRRPPAGVPIQTDSKKKQKLFKRNKKKSHEGNQHSNLNKALLSVNVDSGKSLFSLFILDFAFYFLCATFVFWLCVG